MSGDPDTVIQKAITKVVVFCYDAKDMQSNTHLGETQERRLRRFENESPIEIIETLLNSINHFFNNEIRATLHDPESPQTSLLILGIHSVALTTVHGFFNQGGSRGYKLFLENFVDGATIDTKFSTIAEDIHEWRNVLPHRWLNVAGHQFSYDYTMPEGWKKDGDTILLNPNVYLKCYLDAFLSGGKIWRYSKILNTDAMMQEAKKRFISKYVDLASYKGSQN